MAVKKRLIDPRRIRRIPAEGFSWIDRRFVRDGFIEPLPPEAILLYFFVVSVSDAKGLSFYADPTISKKLKLNSDELVQARARLIDSGLILYEYPLYQVLPLPPKVKEPLQAAFSASARRSRAEGLTSLGEILKLAIEKAHGSESRNEKSKETS